MPKLSEQCQDLQDALIQYREKNQDNEDKLSNFLYNHISHAVDVLREIISELKESENEKS